jgi:hypothetical protein
MTRHNQSSIEKDQLNQRSNNIFDMPEDAQYGVSQYSQSVEHTQPSYQLQQNQHDYNRSIVGGGVVVSRQQDLITASEDARTNLQATFS